MNSSNTNNAAAFLEAAINALSFGTTEHPVYYLTQENDPFKIDFQSIKHSSFSIININEFFILCASKNNQMDVYPCSHLPTEHIVKLLTFKNIRIIFSGHHPYSDEILNSSENSPRFVQILDEQTTPEKIKKCGNFILFNCPHTVTEALPPNSTILLTPLTLPIALSDTIRHRLSHITTKASISS